MTQLLEFNIIFPNEVPLAVEEYLNGSGTELVSTIATYLLSIKDDDSLYVNVHAVVDLFLSHNEDFSNTVKYQIEKYQKQHNRRLWIVNRYSSLRLFESSFFTHTEKTLQSKSEIELNLFKAYLLLNSEFTEKQYLAFETTKKLAPDLQFAAQLFCSQYPMSDKQNYDIGNIWVSEIIKATYLFEYLSQEPKTKPLLESFLLYYGTPTWEDYLVQFITIATGGLNPEKETYTDIHIPEDENYAFREQFLEKLAIQLDEENDPHDFLTLRGQPFYKIADGKYRMIFNLFAIEKIYKGVYFQLNKINSHLEANKIKAFRSFYGETISEQVIAYKAIESIYSCRFQYSGERLRKDGMKAEPDYFIKQGKYVLLFESKDFLIAKEKKWSFDYDTYEKEFRNILYESDNPNGKQSRKAILQLVNNVKRLLQNDFLEELNYHYKDIIIIPILLTHDHQYNVPGFNEILSQWFNEEIEILNEEGLFTSRIQPLTTIDINTIIYNQVPLNKIPLHRVIIDYHKSKKDRQNIFIQSLKRLRPEQRPDANTLIQTYEPFSCFISRHFREKELWELPDVMERIKPTLEKYYQQMGSRPQ